MDFRTGIGWLGRGTGEGVLPAKEEWDQEARDAVDTVLGVVQEGVYLIGRDGRVSRWNQGAERITGYGRLEVLGRDLHDHVLMHCDAAGKSLCEKDCPLSMTLADGKTRSLEAFLQHKSGKRVAVGIRVAAIRDAVGNIAGAVECFEERDVVHPAAQRAGEVPHNGHRDPLTGLDDRAYTELRLHDELNRFKEHRVSFGVLLIEIDKFAELRGHYGHEAGEAVTRVVAGSITSAIRSFDFAGRWDKVRFLAIVDEIGQAELRPAMDRMRLTVNGSQLEWWGSPLPVSVSVGGALVEKGDTIDRLIARAEAALVNRV